jgi:hypothetical protein
MQEACDAGRLFGWRRLTIFWALMSLIGGSEGAFVPSNGMFGAAAGPESAIVCLAVIVWDMRGDQSR